MSSKREVEILPYPYWEQDLAASLICHLFLFFFPEDIVTVTGVLQFDWEGIKKCMQNREY